MQRFPDLPPELENRVYRVALEHDVAGKLCHNVFHVLDDAADGSQFRIEQTAQAFAQWWSGPFLNSAAGPSFYSSIQSSLKNVFTSVIPLRSGITTAAAILVADIIGAHQVETMPNNVAPLMRWSTDMSRTHARTYLVGFPLDLLSTNDRQSIDADVVAELVNVYDKLVPYLSEGLHDFPGGLTLVLRRRRVQPVYPGIWPWVAPITGAYHGSRRVCTQRRRMRAP